MIKSIRTIFQAAVVSASFFFVGLSSAFSVAPAPMQNFCPVVLVNRSTLPSTEVYFVCHGNDPDGIPCFLVPDPGTGICAIVYPTPSGTPSSASVSVTLSQLPAATSTGITTGDLRLIYLPINSASRGYLSLKHPMYLATKLNPSLGVLGVDDSSVTTLADPNFYTFYQDFEFGLVQPNVNDSLTRIFINLSWVDYFCLPMQLIAYEYPSNTPISINYSALPSGTESSQTRDQIITAIDAGLNTYPTTWGTLSLPYYADPYTDSVPTTILRVLAAKNSLGLGASANKFNGAKVTQGFFPTNYISDSSTGPMTGVSFVQAVYNYYKTPNTLYTTMHPAGEPAVVYAITADATNLVLTLTGPGGTVPNYTLDLSMLSTEQLLTGANSGGVWPYTLTGGTDSAAYTNELDKLFSALFTVGQLPLTQVVTSPTVPFDNSAYNSMVSPGGYSMLTYFSNPPGYSNGPWYNVYDLDVHLQEISKGLIPDGHNPTLGLAYGYDFDDALNLAGLIALDIQDQYGNPSMETNAIQPYIVMSVEKLDPTKIPDISLDAYSYPVTIEAAPNGAAVSFSHYNGATTTVTPASPTVALSLGTVVVDATHPFQVTFTFDSVNYTFDINLQRQIVTPISNTSTYTAADEQYQGSFTFTVTGPQGSPSFSLAYNSSPPTWPG